MRTISFVATIAVLALGATATAPPAADAGDPDRRATSAGTAAHADAAGPANSAGRRRGARTARGAKGSRQAARRRRARSRRSPAGRRRLARRPKIVRVTPMRIQVGERLVLRGRRFSGKRRRNTVIFRGQAGRTAFVKPRRAKRRRLVVRVPAKVAALLRVREGRQRPTRMRLRVLVAKRFSRFTPRRLSPVVVGGDARGGDSPGGGGSDGGGPVADAPTPCGEGPDYDGDLLPNAVEGTIGTDPCLSDTDLDTIEDGYELQSAKDLNDDEAQVPNSVLPYPDKRPYPNPLDGSDADVDFDGDSLTLREEQRLWRYGIARGRAERTLTPLYYSDGEQYSIYERAPTGARRPSLHANGYSLAQDFLKWASDAGFRTVMLTDHDVPWWDPTGTRAAYDLLDMNRDGDEAPAEPPRPGYRSSEATYYDLLKDGYLSDDERDEDADGLTNFDETHGRMTRNWWASCYTGEAEFGIAYADPDVTDPDTDGDDVRDGADDQDHDDIPNVMELSRNAASGLWDAKRSCVPLDDLPSPPEANHPDAYGRVNPFNPCLPAYQSRTCTLHPGFADNAAPFDDSLDWAALN